MFPQEALCCRYLKCTTALQQLNVMQSLNIVFLAAEEREVNADKALQKFQFSSLLRLYFFCPNTLFPCFSCDCSKEATGGWWCRPDDFSALHPLMLSTCISLEIPDFSVVKMGLWMCSVVFYQWFKLQLA